MKGAYDDIINLPHHVSSTRPHMPMQDRAAQFAPFAALTGYEDAVREAARLTEGKIELTEDAQAVLDAKLRPLADGSMTGKEVTLTWFQPDARKSGGAYVTTTGILKRVDPYENAVVLADGRRIPIADILDAKYDHHT